jgi:hypothetical protein
MVINTSVSPALLPSNPLPVTKSSAQPNPAGAASSTDSPSLSVNAEDLAAFGSELTTDDAAQQSTDFARNSILNQSALTLLAHGQHQSQTVMDLLTQ